MAKEITQWSAMCIAAKEIRCKTVQMKCLLMYYAINANSDGEFYKPAIDICFETGISERNVRRINSILVEYKILTITRPKAMSGRASDYKLNYKALRAAADQSHEISEKAKRVAKDKAKERQAEYRRNHPKFVADNNNACTGQ